MELRKDRITAICNFLKKAAALEREFAKAMDELADSINTESIVKVKEGKTVSPEELIQAYETLWKNCEGVDSQRLSEIVHEFVKGHDKKYLIAFIRINNLPLSPKDSKDHIARGLRQLLAQSAAISAPLSPVGSGFRSSN